LKPLIDADILNYEIGFSSQQIVEGEVQPNSWQFAQDLLEQKIALICDEVQATEEPLLYLTNTKAINKTLNKKRLYQEQPVIKYVENFRHEVAKEKAYKGTRQETKPFHYKNLVQHILASYQTVVNEDGLEADDAMCIEQYSRFKSNDLSTIICSRDKDLKQCPGWHYGWEVGKQASVGPLLVDELGFLDMKNPKKVFGVGGKFFYYQLLVGDSVDNIGGVKGRGPVFAYNLLHKAVSLRQCYELVAEVYVKTWGDDWESKMREQCDLLWMVRELNEQGKKITWSAPKTSG